jgi:hypothetical protein
LVFISEKARDLAKGFPFFVVKMNDVIVSISVSRRVSGETAPEVCHAISCHPKMVLDLIDKGVAGLVGTLPDGGQGDLPQILLEPDHEGRESLAGMKEIGAAVHGDEAAVAMIYKVAVAPFPNAKPGTGHGCQP